jgi:hypothetical protein
VAGAGNINVYKPDGTYLGQLLQPNGAPIAIKGLWDLEFGDGKPDSGKTNWLYFDAGPNHPGDSTGGLFGVIKAAGDQGGNGVGDAVREVTGETLAAGVRRLPRASDLHVRDQVFADLEGTQSVTLVPRADPARTW